MCNKLFNKLIKLYQLLDIADDPMIITEQDKNDGSWVAEIIEDGKLIDSTAVGIGDTKDEAIEDACERFFERTPTIDHVPLHKLLKLLE